MHARKLLLYAIRAYHNNILYYYYIIVSPKYFAMQTNRNNGVLRKGLPDILLLVQHFSVVCCYCFHTIILNLRRLEFKAILLIVLIR